MRGLHSCLTQSNMKKQHLLYIIFTYCISYFHIKLNVLSITYIQYKYYIKNYVTYSLKHKIKKEFEMYKI